jgi:uncharacterized protein (TIGR01319 family)
VKTDELTRICVTDVGSTTTKAILFRRSDGGAWDFVRREAATTVERPHEDVSVGVLEAIRALEGETGEVLLSEGGPSVPYLSTSSAGGGLAMVVTGLVKELTAETADRVALGAGAIVLDVISMNDGRTAYRQIEDLKRLRPDMVLLAGGYDGEAISAPVFLAELLVESELRPKLNPDARLPVVYGGNVNARAYVEQALGDGFMVRAVPNVRPDEGREVTRPARNAIHELFMEHVMSMAPGYDRLKSWVAAPVRPTPAAFASLLALVTSETDEALLAIDIGGATTDVFSAYRGEVVRTVSANIGMSYSALNVARLAGTHQMSEMLGNDIGDRELWNRIGNKHVHPTSLPATAEDAAVEWATATLAVREAVREHMKVMTGLPERERPGPFDINAMLREEPSWPEPAGRLRIAGYDLVVGSGGILSHSPREAAAAILARALGLEDEAQLAVDSAFMFPHLGVLGELDPRLAGELFRDLALVRLGSVEEACGRFLSGSVGLGDFEPGGARRAESDGRRVNTGRIAVRRELASDGEVLVRPGQSVTSDEPVARSVRQFLRPFFLNVTRVLKVPAEELGGVMLKGVGDFVERDEIIAEHAAPRKLRATYRSPVEGKIEKMLPDGTVVVRESPEKAQVLTTIKAAEELGVYPEKLKPYLRVDVGDEIERGQWVAAIVSGGSFKTSVSPVRGRVSRIDKHFGMVMIEPLLEELEVLAWLPGTVESVNERGCVVAGEGVEITGVWGSGGEAAGTLTNGRVEAGAVVVVQRATGGLLADCREAGVAGVVAGSLDLEDALDPNPGFTLVALGDFGGDGPREDVMSVFDGREGSLALLDGTTQLRVGVRRPRVILPD